MTQIAKIQIHLEKGYSITPIEALREYGCFRLASVIHKLKSEGMDIITHIVTGEKDEDGYPKHYARYHVRRIKR